MQTVERSTLAFEQDTGVQKLLQRLEARIDRFASLAMLAVVVLFSVWAWFASRQVRFWYDELLELSAARASTISGLLAHLRAGVDFNPPLSHILIRVTTSLFGESEWAARLPAFLGMVLLLVCVYLFVSRWINRVYGIMAALVLLCLPVREYAIQGRPYGLVLGFSALLILLYQHAVCSKSRTMSLLGIGLCAGSMVASHYYAALVIAVLIPVELYRTWRAGEGPDWALLLSIAGPPVIVLALLRDIISSQRHQLTNYFSRGNLLSFDHGYDIFDVDPLVYCLALVLITLLLALRLNRASRQSISFPKEAGALESLLGAGLLLLPIIGAFCTQFVTHAYVTRYFLPAAIGFSICVCLGARLLSTIVPGIAVLLILPLCLGFGKAILQQAHRPAPPLPPAESLDATTGPILFDTPSSYLEIYHYFPRLRERIWVISDPAAQMHYRKYDTDDKIMLAMASMGDARATTLKAAAHQWSHFSLIPRTGDYVWALKCVMESGAEVRVSHAFTDSNFIFDVTLQPGSLARIEACGSGPG